MESRFFLRQIFMRQWWWFNSFFLYFSLEKKIKLSNWSSDESETKCVFRVHFHHRRCKSSNHKHWIIINPSRSIWKTHSGIIFFFSSLLLTVNEWRLLQFQNAGKMNFFVVVVVEFACWMWNFFRSFLSVSWIKNWNFKIIYSSEKQSHYNNQTILWHRIMEFFLTIKHRFILFFLFILVCSSNKPLYNALEPDFFSCFVSGSTIYSGRAQFHWNYWYLALGKWYLFFIFIPNVTFSLVLFYYVSLLKFH